MAANESLGEPSARLAPEWRFVASVYLKKKHCVIYRDDRLAVQLQVINRRRSWILFPPKEKEYYFIDGESKVYCSEVQLVARLRRRLSRNKSHLAGRISYWRRLAYALNLM